jgi:hypothetical protein
VVHNNTHKKKSFKNKRNVNKENISSINDFFQNQNIFFGKICDKSYNTWQNEKDIHKNENTEKIIKLNKVIFAIFKSQRR